MGSPVPPGIVQPPWSQAFPADFQGRILSTIVEGSPFSRSTTPLPTQRGSVAFGILDLEDPAWGGELSEVPDLSKDQSSYEVAVSRLSGSILVSLESIHDSDFPLSQQVSQTIIDTFSNRLDRDMIGSPGPLPRPTGILSVAAAVDGEDLQLAAISAKASIATAGGSASHIVMNPAHLGGLEAERDELGRQLYPDAAASFVGLQTVISVGATQPVVYDRARVWLVINRDYTVDLSRETEAAWSHYAQSIRVVARFALAVPQPSKACRKLTVAGAGPVSAPQAKAKAK